MTDKMREEFETAVALEAKEPVLAVYLSRRDDTYSTSTSISHGGLGKPPTRRC
ncbi:hypothetical protein VRC34_09190 [Pseudomonas poae]